jgi:hypothetical protein
MSNYSITDQAGCYGVILKNVYFVVAIRSALFSLEINETNEILKGTNMHCSKDVNYNDLDQRFIILKNVFWSLSKLPLREIVKQN